jgi:hypothetical protein
MKTGSAIMRRLVKILLLPALLFACGSVGLLHVQGQREARSNESIEVARQSVSRYGDVMIYVRDGSFALKKPMLTKMMGSVILKGDLVNRTNLYLDEATFEIKAYGRDGRLLKGVEEKTVFAVRQFRANASMPVNSGYGVWLQGIPLDAIARIEISETGDEAARSSLIRMIPFASHAVFWNDYSEVEE